MVLTFPQLVMLLQVGDLVESQLNLYLIIAVNLLQYYTGGNFDNWLDAVDATYCGGDDPTQVSSRLASPLASPHSRKFLVQDGIYPDHKPGGYDGGDFPDNVVSHCS